MFEPRYQFVWWPRIGFGFKRFEDRKGLGSIYRWALGIGPLEVRRWRLNRSEYRAKKQELLANR